MVRPHPAPLLRSALNPGAAGAEDGTVARADRLGGLLLRWRYAVLAAWAVPWLAVAEVRRPQGLDDFLWFELGARLLAHHHAPAHAGPALHLYASYPVIQVGPPSLLLLAAAQWLRPHLVMVLADLLMAALALVSLRSLERVAVAAGGRPPREVARGTLAGGALLVPVWAWESVMWRHLDDAIALTAALLAARLVASGRRELLAGLLLGTGVAAKPWAVLLVPVLLGYAAPRRPRAVLATLGAAVVWWLPFVVADPATVQAVGAFGLPVTPGTVWHLLGVTSQAPSWVRLVQLGGGTVLAAAVGRRAGWTAVPLLALAWRVSTDPYAWPYYSLGPLLGAVLWDLTRPVRGRLGRVPVSPVPVLTVTTWLVLTVVPRELPALSAPVRLVWFAGLLLLATRAGRPAASAPSPPPQTAGTQTAAALVAAV